jgi:hypothetical protein
MEAKKLAPNEKLDIENILSAVACLEKLFYRPFHRICFLGKTETVAQHHSCRQDGGNGVCHVLSRQIGSASVDGFIHAEGPSPHTG